MIQVPDELLTSDWINIIIGLIVVVVTATIAAIGQMFVSRGPMVQSRELPDSEDLSDWESLCEVEDCRAAKSRLDTARNDLAESCARYKRAELAKNIAYGTFIALTAIAAALWVVWTLLGIIGKILLWPGVWAATIAAVAALAAYIVASLILTVRLTKYTDCVTEFRAAVGEVLSNCNSYCWQAMDLELPVCT